jgi:hypothetical protein
MGNDICGITTAPAQQAQDWKGLQALQSSLSWVSPLSSLLHSSAQQASTWYRAVATAHTGCTDKNSTRMARKEESHFTRDKITACCLFSPPTLAIRVLNHAPLT